MKGRGEGQYEIIFQSYSLNQSKIVGGVYICYLAAPFINHHRWDDLIHPMLITRFLQFDQKVTDNLVGGLGP